MLVSRSGKITVVAFPFGDCTPYSIILSHTVIRQKHNCSLHPHPCVMLLQYDPSMTFCRMLLQMRSDPDVATNIGCAVSWSMGGGVKISVV